MYWSLGVFGVRRTGVKGTSDLETPGRGLGVGGWGEGLWTTVGDVGRGFTSGRRWIHGGWYSKLQGTTMIKDPRHSPWTQCDRNWVTTHTDLSAETRTRDGVLVDTDPNETLVPGDL